MRLRKERNIITNNYLISSKPPPSHHNKNSSMDIPPSAKEKNIYLNKILQKNLGSQRITIDQANLRENMHNFQSSIQSILANEESRQRAKNYVLNMRSKKGPLSPYSMQGDQRKIIFSNTNYDGFYDPKRKNNYEIKENIYRSSNNSKKEIVAVKQKNMNDKQYYYNNYGVNTPDKVIRVNKITKNYEENINSTRDPYIGKTNPKNDSNMNRINSSRGAFNKNANNNNSLNMFRNANTNYPLNSNKHVYYQKKQYSENNFDNLNIKNDPYYINKYNVNNLNNLNIDENDFDDNFIFSNHLDTNSLSENNNSGLREIVIDNINEIFQSPASSPKQFEMVQEETIKYSNNKKVYEVNNSSNNKSNKGSTGNTGNTGVYNKFKKNSKNNFSIPSSLNNTKNKVMSKNYTKSNINSSNKKTQDKFINRFNLDNKFNNLKIEKNRFRIAAAENKKDVDYNSDIMQKIKNRFLQNIKAITVNEINVKGTENKRI